MPPTHKSPLPVPAPAKKPRVGGRSARVLEQVAEAVIAELHASGMAGFSVPRVAQRAGVHTATIYRRWATTGALIAFAAGALAKREMPAPDTGSLAGDLRARLQNLRAFLEGPYSAMLLGAAFASGEAPELERMKRDYWSARAQDRESMFQRACQRGEIDPQADFESMIEIAIGPLYVRRYISLRPIDDAFMDQLVALALVSCRR